MARVMKRFWRHAAVVADNATYSVLLDGKPMRLPEGPALHVRSAALAHAIAEEWGKAGADFVLEDVPLTRLAGTAQARVAPDPGPSIASLSAYAESDLLCYRAETPSALARRQAEAWDPWLAWAERRHNARLHTTIGIAHIAQPPSSIAALRQAVAALDPFALTGLGIIVPRLGSLVLGLATLQGDLSAADAHLISIADELHQESLWGVDRDALARRRAVAADIAEAARFIALSVSPR